MALACLAAALGAPVRAQAQLFRGYAQVQYQKFDVVENVADRELWVSTIQVDATKRFSERYDLSAQIYFSETDYVRRTEGIRSPRGTLRLTHPFFGLSALYRPVRHTDPLGFRTQRDELQLAGYLSRPGWPFVNGSWIRREVDPGTTAPTSTGLLRSLSAGHTLGPLALRAAYSDQSRDTEQERLRADERRNAAAGATLQLAARQATLLTSYDVTETRETISDDVASRTVQHLAGLNGGARIGPRTDASLAYSYRKTLNRVPTGPDLDDHDGNLLGRYALTRAVNFQAGGGLRTVRDVAQNDVQWYVLAIASVDGRIRPRWTGGASVARSYNWNPGAQARPIDTYQANTKMNLARGLDFSLVGQVNVTDEGSGALRDTVGQSARVVSYGSATVNAAIMRGLTAFVSAQGYRSGEHLTGDAVTSASNTTELRWTPQPGVQIYGSWRRSRALGTMNPTVTIWQGTTQWTPSKRVDLSAFYQKSDQERGNPNTFLPAGQETWTLRGLLGLTRELRAIGVWSTVNPGKPTRSSRIEATLTYRFR